MPNKPELPEPAPDGQLPIYNDGATRLQVRLEGSTAWLSQRLIAELFQVSVKTTNEHLVKEGSKESCAKAAAEMRRHV